MERAVSDRVARPTTYRHSRRRRWAALGSVAALVAGLLAGLAVTTTPATAAGSGRAAPAGAVPLAADPTFGPHVVVFDPSMSTSSIQATVDAIATLQDGNQFGSERYALLFKPGIYGTTTAPLNFRVGYYTAVAGLGLSPDDVTINGSVYVHNQCDAGGCVALNNFWRSLENLRINVTTPDLGCYSGEFWAVSQAAPMRRVHVIGQTTLMDYCTGPSFASGGFIADSKFDGTVINGSQQQWLTRNSTVGPWTNGVWNQVFSGVDGAPAECFPQGDCGGPYTVVAHTPVSREKPFLYVDGAGRYRVFVPAVRHDSHGTSWESGQQAGRSVPLTDFLVATPDTGVKQINAALRSGRNLLLTPGVYDVDHTIQVKRADTVVLGIGFPTLTPTKGNVTMTVGDVAGPQVSGIIFDAGPRVSRVLLRVGSEDSRRSYAADPAGLQDVFFRIGGAAAGRAKVSLEVNSNDTILDNTWAWRADHGNGVGWTVNTADTGVVVEGDKVSAYGLFVEHYQKAEVIWRGQDGRVVFFQNEMPYDPPSQAAWMSAPGVRGYPALDVADSVRTFHGSGMGSYSFFNQGVDVFADRAFLVPETLPPGSLHDLLTIFLDPANGRGGIAQVVNDTGGSSTIANPDVPVTVVDYP